MRVSEIVLSCRLSQAMQTASDCTFCFFLSSYSGTQGAGLKGHSAPALPTELREPDRGLPKTGIFHPSSHWHHSILLNELVGCTSSLLGFTG
jgi:hypothetical protein